MVDLCDKLYSDEMDTNKCPEAASSSEDSHVKKTCADCGTSKTPLWRGGPAGPKSLCNACGIRSRKKRRAILGINAKSEEKKTASKKMKNSSGGSLNHNKFVSIGKEVMMQRSRMEKQWRKLGEDEQAAVLLMALSYGSVHA